MKQVTVKDLNQLCVDFPDEYSKDLKTHNQEYLMMLLYSYIISEMEWDDFLFLRPKQLKPFMDEAKQQFYHERIPTEEINEFDDDMILKVKLYHWLDNNIINQIELRCPNVMDYYSAYKGNKTVIEEEVTLISRIANVPQNILWDMKLGDWNEVMGASHYFLEVLPQLSTLLETLLETMPKAEELEALMPY